MPVARTRSVTHDPAAGKARVPQTRDSARAAAGRTRTRLDSVIMMIKLRVTGTVTVRVTDRYRRQSFKFKFKFRVRPYRTLQLDLKSIMIALPGSGRGRSDRRDPTVLCEGVLSTSQAQPRSLARVCTDSEAARAHWKSRSGTSSSHGTVAT